MFLKTIVLILLILIFTTNAYAETFQLDKDRSKIIYSLSKFGIPFKIKALKAEGQIYLDKDLSSLNNYTLLRGVDLKTNFTSRNALFRKAIDYDRYPYFLFSSDLTQPIILSNSEFVQLPGYVTFHGTTEKVLVELKHKSDNHSVSLVGYLNVRMTDFGIEPPKIFFISIDDLIRTKIELYLDVSCKL
ncbi:MAG: YceI family protein [Candidatus Melainabacteria bacterium]|nr:YceI family protein [Candidatus Melainabacteria bacterium]